MKIKALLITLIMTVSIALAPLSLAAESSKVTNKDFSSFNLSEVFVEEEVNGEEQSIIGKLINQSVEPGAQSDSPIMLFIIKIINTLMMLIGTFAFVAIIFGGIILATSSGDEGRIDRGKSILTQAVLGLVFAFLSYTIVLFVQSFFY